MISTEEKERETKVGEKDSEKTHLGIPTIMCISISKRLLGQACYFRNAVPVCFVCSGNIRTSASRRLSSSHRAPPEDERVPMQ